MKTLKHLIISICRLGNGGGYRTLEGREPGAGISRPGKINRNPQPGLKALIEATGLKDKIITTRELAFILAPRL